ncbi:unnamed protein product [Closterium sp. Naga37s-1]|nr:unnamed protein product [Closterium sp. Naga37s-1]
MLAGGTGQMTQQRSGTFLSFDACTCVWSSLPHTTSSVSGAASGSASSEQRSVLSLEPLLGALAAGNVVVLKPSELSPACSHLLSRLLPLYLDSQAVQAGAIRASQQVVEGGPETGKALLGRRWDKIFFTGGTALGRIVMEAASKHLTPVTLELGGKNPLFIDESADLEVCAADLEVRWRGLGGAADSG